MDWFADPQAWIALLTLTVLEIVLGMAFSVFVEMLNLRVRGSRPVALKS